jgi:hypothetical protein
VSGQGEGTGWRMPARDAELKFKPVQDAVLWGGNLCVLTSLLGTPYFPVVDKGVLFIEDTNEHPYRVERMLDQLKLAGVLARQKAIVFGQFTGVRKRAGLRPRLRHEHRDRPAARHAQGARAGRPAVRPCAYEGAASGGREGGDGGRGARRVPGLGPSARPAAHARPFMTTATHDHTHHGHDHARN